MTARPLDFSVIVFFFSFFFLKRYVDDVFEGIRKGEVDRLTDHLNQTDPPNSIKFTYEQEKDGSIPFLDTLIIHKPDGSVKLCVYRKKTHTHQYLEFSSHHCRGLGGGHNWFP